MSMWRNSGSLSRHKRNNGEYGYTCSMCGHFDTFNEVAILERPPVEMIKIKLYDMAPRVPSSGEQHTTVVELTVPCARRERHSPVACEDSVTDSCTQQNHWKICQGFFKLSLLVTFGVAKLAGDRYSICDVHVKRILSKVATPGKGRGKDSLTSLEEVSSSVESLEQSDVMPQSLSKDEVKASCRSLMDVLFTKNAIYTKQEFLYYLVKSREECIEIASEKIIRESPLVYSDSDRHQVEDYNIKGILLHCDMINNQNTSIANTDTYIKIPAYLVCKTLYSRRRSHTPKLYFHSYSLCRGEFGIKHVTVVLILVSKAAKNMAQYCEANLEPLNIRMNPFLQVSPSLQTIRSCIVDDPTLKLHIKVLLSCKLCVDDHVLAL